MAVVPALPENSCHGVRADGTANYKLKCLKGLDTQGNPVYTCATWRRFKVSCPGINQLCNAQSQAWVAAITVCNQHLYN